jgi:hypothetical protein|tara:strand:- start:331 stop:1530 length:1200 start_codon:yes stop_codon:yes gene_type:complete
MATKGKAPASRSLNYSLSPDIMNRVKGSLDSGSTIQSIEKGMSGITDTLDKAADKAIKKKEEIDNADALYEVGMEQFGSRASWSTPGTYDKFLAIEEEQRLEYNRLVANGDKKGAAKALRMQKERAVQQQTWKGVFEGLKDIELLSDMDPDSKYVIGRLTSQEGEDFKVEYTDKGEMVMKFLKQDANGNLLPDLPENYITMRGTEFDKLITRNRKPIKEQEAIAGLTKTLEEDKTRLKPFSFSNTLANNKKIITKDNIYSMMRGDLGITEGGSFLNSIENHPDFEGIKFAQSFDSAADAGMKLKIGDNSGLEDVAGSDNIIEKDEFMKLSADDKQKVIELMQKPENFEIAKYYLAEFVTLTQMNHLNKYDPILPGTSGKRFSQALTSEEQEIFNNVTSN